MMGSLGSLTGGGGLSNSSSAAASNGDQNAGRVSFGNFNSPGAGVSHKNLIIAAGVVFGAIALYAISKKTAKRK